jgi:RND family efflux transporter MFP subunit
MAMRLRRSGLAMSLVVAVVAIAVAVAAAAHAAPAPARTVATYTVRAQSGSASYTATGTIEAVRQGTVAAQVSGRITDVPVRNGDAVQAGQALVRIEAGDDGDAVVASAAAASGAAARLLSARGDYERAQRLRAQEYLSAAAMQRAEAALHSAEAEAAASAAQAKAARTRAQWHTVTAPYAGQVTQLWVSAGDLATPGKPLLAIYDPAALRVVAQVPESLAARINAGKPAQLLAGAQAVAISNWQVVGAVDPITHSVAVRAELPSGTRMQPGQFASLQLPLRDGSAPLQVPSSAIVIRSEVTAVYVVDGRGAAHLPQVRLGPALGAQVTVLSGLQAGERVALDPAVAARP